MEQEIAFDNEKLERLASALERASIWQPAVVEEEPELKLYSWSVFEATFSDGSKSRHFVGAEDFGTGRVSSAIQTFDAENMKGITRSGRVYELSGKTGMSSNAAYVWDIWKRRNSVTSWENVSDKIKDGMERPDESVVSGEPAAPGDV